MLQIILYPGFFCSKYLIHRASNRIEQLLVEDSRMNRAHLRRREEHGASEMLRPGFDELLDAVRFLQTNPS